VKQFGGLSFGPQGMKIADVHVVALHDKKRGVIRHMHQVVVLGGATPVSLEEAVESAHERAASFGIKPGTLGVKASKDLEHARLPHKIDLKSGAFVVIEMPKAPRKPASK
jgi:hypothetical protein